MKSSCVLSVTNTISTNSQQTNILYNSILSQIEAVVGLNTGSFFLKANKSKTQFTLYSGSKIQNNCRKWYKRQHNKTRSNKDSENQVETTHKNDLTMEVQTNNANNKRNFSR